MTETTAAPCHDYPTLTVSPIERVRIVLVLRWHLLTAGLTRWIRRILGVTAQIETVRREARETEAAHEAALANLKAEMIEQVEASHVAMRKLAATLHAVASQAFETEGRMRYHEQHSAVLGENRKKYLRERTAAIAERQAQAERALKPESDASEPQQEEQGPEAAA